MPRSLNQISDNSNGRWTEDRVAEFENELALALVEQVHAGSPATLGHNEQYSPAVEIEKLPDLTSKYTPPASTTF